MTIKEILSTQYKTIAPDTPIINIKESIFRDKYLVIMDGKDYKGLLIPVDLINKKDTTAIHCITPKPEIQITENIYNVTKIMESESLHVVPVFAEKKFIGVLTYKDIVKLLLTQQNEFQKHIASEEKTESLKLFASGIVHDINNILMIINGYIALLEFEYEENNLGSPVLNDLKNGLNSLNDLAQQLQLFYKDIPLKKEEFALLPFFENILKFYCKGTDVSFSINLAPEILFLYADKFQMTQLFSNLILNGIQAMQEKGVITVNVNTDSIFYYKHNSSPANEKTEMIHIQVLNSGPIIPQNIQNRIFDPYFTTKKKGSGIGLALCSSIAKNHNGAIILESSPEKGTSFHVYIPEKNGQSVKENKNEINHSLCIIYDDDPLITNILSLFAKNLGISCLILKNENEINSAIQSAVLQKYKNVLFLSDLYFFGEKLGHLYAKPIKEECPDFCTVLMSSYIDDEAFKEYKKYFYDNILAKPFTFDDFNKLIHEMFPGG